MKGKFMKKIIVIMSIFLLAFTIYHSYMFYKIGSEPSTLIMSVFAVCSVEAISLMAKKLREAKIDESREFNDNIRDTEHLRSTSECDCGTCEECISSRSNTY